MAGGHLAILDAEFLDDAVDVVLDRVDREPKLARDLLIAEVPVRDQAQDLKLPPGQLAVSPTHGPPARLAEPAGLREQPMGDLRRAVTPTREDILDRLAQVNEGIIIQNATVRTGLEAHLDQVRRRRGNQEDRPRAPVGRPKRLDEAECHPVGQARIDQQKIPALRLGRTEHLRLRVIHAHDIHVVIDAKSQDQAFPEQAIPVTDDQADIRGHGRELANSPTNRSLLSKWTRRLIWTGCLP
jgi:hypothetical protein